jgi:hypothetical protein
VNYYHHYLFYVYGILEARANVLSVSVNMNDPAGHSFLVPAPHLRYE